MNKSLQAGLGVLLVVMGVIFGLQGLGVIKGSALMSGKTLWAIIGPVVAIIGVLVVARALRTRPSR
ncbi:MAG TPA: hypothetical protein VIM49_04995 [Dermatophilaceae bacterium]|jgi:Mg2+ and Co2+ transporter CorA